ncbi:MAG TPA: thioredoxin family protein [Thermoplasmata archaeon]|nr:thioredoxin family protein [Thermoplasmata archaeon]
MPRRTSLFSTDVCDETVLEAKDPNTFRKEVLESDQPTVALFWATWCPFCRKFKPEFDRLAAAKPWRFVSVYLDDESNPLWDDYAVDVVPTLVLFRGGELVEREDGVLGYGLDRRMVDDFVHRVSVKLP